MSPVQLVKQLRVCPVGRHALRHQLSLHPRVISAEETAERQLTMMIVVVDALIKSIVAPAIQPAHELFALGHRGQQLGIDVAVVGGGRIVQLFKQGPGSIQVADVVVPDRFHQLIS